MVPAMLTLLVLLPLASILMASPGQAGLAPTSPERSPGEAAGERRQPAVAAGHDGFLVVWTDVSDGSRIRGRLFSIDGNPLGDEILIGPEDGAAADAPDVTTIGTGFVVAWREDPAGADAPPRMVARLLDDQGVPVGDGFQLDTTRSLPVAGYYVSAPSIAGRADGFLATWASGTRKEKPLYRSHENAFIWTRHFDTDGSATSEDLDLSAYVTGQSGPFELEPKAVASSSGFLVTAHENFFSNAGVWRLDPSGNPLAPGIPIGSTENSWVRLAPHAKTFHVVWSMVSANYRATTGTAQARRVSLDGEGLETFVQLSEGAARRAGNEGVAAAALSRGRLLGVWAARASETPSEVGELGIVARLMDGRGHLIQDEFVVTEIHDGVAAPEVAILDDSHVAVVWESGDGDVHLRTLRIFSPACGDGDENGVVTAADALSALRSSVGLERCAPCACDADGSGAHTASDALVVLRTAIGLVAELACPICSEGTGVPFDIPMGCAGAHVTVPRDALPANLDLVSCSASPNLSARGCKLSLTVDEEGLVFDARGSGEQLFGRGQSCPLSGAVFACHVPDENVGAIARNAVVECACGCRECTEAPRLCSSSSEGRACSPEKPLVAVGPVRPAGVEHRGVESPTVAFTSEPPTVVTTSTSTPFCGTCCNLDELGTLRMQENEPTITELRVRVRHDYDGDCFECYSIDPTGIRTEAYVPGYQKEGEFREICIIDHDGIQGPFDFATCEGYGDFDFGPVEVLFARGKNFERLATPPVITMEKP